MNDGWVDIHAHFTPPITEAERQTRWEAMRAAHFLAPAPHVWSPESALASMDALGIAMQMLSNIPGDRQALRDSNDYGAEVVAAHPNRFGLLAALPADDPHAAVDEIGRATHDLGADGFALSTSYGGVSLADPCLEPMWAELDRRSAVVFLHPDTAIPAALGLATPLLEVAFETARTVVALAYAGVLDRHRRMRLVLAHCGGALPALSGRIRLLGAEPWVDNPLGRTTDGLAGDFARLYLDTAASGSDAILGPALTMVPRDHLVFGADNGVPCSTDASIAANIAALQTSALLTRDDVHAIGRRGFELFPTASRRRNNRAAA